GGNPVSCAAAIANIEFLQREDLSSKARQDGDYILAQLGLLQERYPIIGDVRGLGLMIGVELVSDDGLTPAPAQAEAIRAICLEKGVLVGVGGVYGNVVRIQPPLVITRDQIDYVLEVLEQILTGLL
ncbi:MAG TPA: aminotransferase class III-fold pyridoxal phosphate-dependent enzyme, partial [Chloroflexia bacterium]|nr:aminotransferase class III-fold pyridoxal phosphate-dependent enzyme [Chloroflexia bacterium]